MASILYKVNDQIVKELDLIKDAEGLGNRTATFTFLIKYYFLTKNNSLDKSIKVLEKLLDKIDSKKLPSLKDQLKDV